VQKQKQPPEGEMTLSILPSLAIRNSQNIFSFLTSGLPNASISLKKMGDMRVSGRGIS
jgi:hypothetical protein